MTSKSYWEIITKKRHSYPSLDGEIKVDVCIIGGGITGVTAANYLIEQGKKVAILETNTIGGATTSKSTGNLYVPIQPFFQNAVKKFNYEKVAQIATARRLAIDHIEKTVHQNKLACDFSRRPWYAFAHNKIDVLDDEHYVLKKLGIPVTYTKELPFDLRFKKAMVIPDQARFNPMQYVVSLAEHVAKKDCLIYENSQVTRYTENKYCTAFTKQGKVVADYLFLATHTPIGINSTQFFVAPYRSYVVASQKKEKLPEGHLWDLDTTLIISTHGHGTTSPQVLMVSGNHHKTGQKGPMIKRYAALEDYFSRLHTGTPEYAWSAQHYQAADDLPYIGLASATHQKTYLATGYFADGLTYGTLAGLLIADSIQKKAREEQKTLDAKRINLIHALPAITKENTNVLCQYLKDLPLKEKPINKNILKEGEGTIMQINHEKVAVCRHNNKLHIHSAVCPHMKCIVQWNDAEKTWDCPCHGSRFDFNGDYLEGPAMSNLPKVDL